MSEPNEETIEQAVEPECKYPLKESCGLLPCSDRRPPLCQPDHLPDVKKKVEPECSLCDGGWLKEKSPGIIAKALIPCTCKKGREKARLGKTWMDEPQPESEFVKIGKRYLQGIHELFVKTINEFPDYLESMDFAKKIETLSKAIYDNALEALASAEKQLKIYDDLCNEQGEQIEKLTSENQRLREANIKYETTIMAQSPYLRHTKECPLYEFIGLQDKNAPICTCGLDKATGYEQALKEKG